MSSSKLRINLGCGPVYVEDPDWVNFDFSASSPWVTKANLLKRLPLANGTVSVVYSSHFLEHVPRDSVNNLLADCLRVLEPGGVIRLVLPDLENLAREYLKHREAGEDEKALFLVIELIDQSVRSKPGGMMGLVYKKLSASSGDANSDMIRFVKDRVGESIMPDKELGRSRAFPPKLKTATVTDLLKRLWIRLWVQLLPGSFRQQNVSLAAVGERHQWLWDFQQLKAELEEVGFVNVTKTSANKSRVKDFPYESLDLDAEGSPRKGQSSMFVEATKPEELNW